ncbi:hypothetical protein [Sphingomonas sp. 28-63-12]|uniref:hypothetical protein n=1 Tax=Sphingomonas sp. 28-63-12 TaxID=1970434 RepID=UPI0035A8ABBF
MILMIGLTAISLLFLFLQNLARDFTKFIGARYHLIDASIEKCLLNMILIDQHRIALLVDRFAQQGIGDRLMEVVELLRHRRDLRTPVGERHENSGAVPVARRMGAHLLDEIHRDAQIFAQMTDQNPHRRNVAGWLTQALCKYRGDSVGAVPDLITEHRDKFDRIAVI